MKRLHLLLVALLAGALLVAGCGGDDEDGGGDQGTPPAAQTDTGGGDAGADTGGGEDTGGDTGGGEETPANVDEAIEQCKQSAQGAPNISDEARKDLEEICEKAASGDEEEVRKATRDVCVRIIEDTVPEGPARDQAVATCDQATQTP
jgi:hypothetical protein